MPTPDDPLLRLLERFDPTVFDVGERTARLRIEGAGPPRLVVLEDSRARIAPADDRRPDAVLSADAETWASVADDLRGGMAAFRAGRLRLRHDLHLGVGFLAATAFDTGPGRLRLRRIETTEGPMSITEAGSGPPVLMLHGLGATKVSFLPTVAALQETHRAIAIDLPGFGDSTKPIGAAYDAAYFARAVLALADALELDRPHVVGNSMGGRVALELGLTAPGRIGRLALLAPSLAWRRPRPWAPLLRMVPPQLGLIQPAPRAIVEAIVANVIPGGGDGWTAAGVDEFLRSYLTPRGRAAFYGAARNIYLEEPFGATGFWTRLESLASEALFVWGRNDQLVPYRFARHVREALPHAEHLALGCGHVPQLERPGETHAALARFLGAT